MLHGLVIKYTPEGYSKLKSDYEQLLLERPDAVENLKKARELGDLRENGYYKASRMRLSSIDSRLFHLKHLLKYAEVIKLVSTECVTVGCLVKLEKDGKQMIYRIVNRFETNPEEGKLSEESPIGRAIIGRKAGDEVTVKIPSGTATYKISDIKI